MGDSVCDIWCPVPIWYYKWALGAMLYIWNLRNEFHSFYKKKNVPFSTEYHPILTYNNESSIADMYNQGCGPWLIVIMDPDP